MGISALRYPGKGECYKYPKFKWEVMLIETKRRPGKTGEENLGKEN